MLINTFPKKLVEASPYDKRWAVGLSITNPKIHEIKWWKGENLLGQIIADVRQELMESIQFVNKQLERLCQTVREAFCGKRRALENKPTRTLSRRASNSRPVRKDEIVTSLEDGYAQYRYLPSPTLLTPSTYSIWCAFYPHHTSEVCPVTAKSVVQEVQSDFSIWCAFFPDCLDRVSTASMEPVLPTIKTPGVLKTYQLPKSMPPPSMSLNILSTSAVRTSPTPTTLSLIVPVGFQKLIVPSTEIAAKSILFPFTGQTSFPTSTRLGSAVSQIPVVPILRSETPMPSCKMIIHMPAIESAAIQMSSTTAVRSESSTHLTAVMPFFVSVKARVLPKYAGWNPFVPPMMSKGRFVIPFSRQASLLMQERTDMFIWKSETRPVLVSVESVGLSVSIVLRAIVFQYSSRTALSGVSKFIESRFELSFASLGVFYTGPMQNGLPLISLSDTRMAIREGVNTRKKGICFILPSNHHAVSDFCTDVISKETPVWFTSPTGPLICNSQANDTGSKTCSILPANQGEGEQNPRDTTGDGDLVSPTLPGVAQKRSGTGVGFYEEAYQIFLEIENKFKANPSYLHQQRDITGEIRSKTISWMSEVSGLLELSPAGLFLSVNYLDRFMSQCLVTKNNIQLAAVTCMFIAGKFEDDVEYTGVDDLVSLCGHAYTSGQIRRFERLLLRKLQFHLHVPTVEWFSTELLHVCQANKKLEYLTLFFAELTMLDMSYIKEKPSKLAAAALCLARYHLDLQVWTEQLWEMSHYLPEDLLPVIRCITQTSAFYRKMGDGKRSGIFEKYSRAKYHEVATILNFPENIDRLVEKCKELGAVWFVSPSRSSSIRFRLWQFMGHDTPFTYDPEAEQLPVHTTWRSRESFEQYSAETYSLMLQSECEHMADPAYMTQQTALTVQLRQLEINWLVRAIELGNYPSSCLLLAVNLKDRFLSLRFVKREKHRLLSLACLFIATKYESRYQCKIGGYLELVGNAYSKAQLIGLEKLILTELDFHLVVPTAAWFCEELLDVCSANDSLKSLTRTKLLLERSGYGIWDFRWCLRSLFNEYRLSADHQGEIQHKYRKLEYMSVADFSRYPVPEINQLFHLYNKEMDQT